MVYVCYTEIEIALLLAWFNNKTGVMVATTN